MSKYLNESLPIDEREGQIGFNKDGDKMKIIEYNTYDDIIVKFLDGNNCEVHTQYVNFQKGIVKNYNKIVYGKHGYLGQGPYTSEHRDENGKRILHNEYAIWKGIHERVGNFDGKHPSYIDVTVNEIWWCYQNFAEWYNEHRYDTGDDFLCIDKDLLIPGNREYAPDKCCLIPNSINEIFRNYKNYKRTDDGLPIGIHRRTDSKSIRYRSEGIYLDEWGNKCKIRKTFTNVLEAFIFYKEYKELYIQQLANKYKDKLDPKVYDILMNYKIHTNVDFNKFI